MENVDTERAERLARRAPESLNPAGLRLMALLGSSASLTDQLDALTHYVESYEPSILCSIMLADEARQTLILTAASSLPSAWSNLVSAVAIKEGAGSCGTAAARLAPVIVSDVQTSPLWVDYAAAAIAAGLRACWSVPFVDTDGQLLGTLALYYRMPRTPMPAERQLIDVAAELAALVTVRHREAASARKSARRLRELVHRSSAPLLVRRADRIVFVNAAARTLLGLEVAPGVVNLPLEAIAAGVDLARLSEHQAGSDVVHLKDARGRAVPVRVTVTPEGAPCPESFILTCVDERQAIVRERLSSDAADEHLTRVADDLNNEVCQQLTGIEYLIASAVHGASPSSVEALQLAQLQLQRARRDTSLLAAWLVPPAAAEGNILGALETLLQHIGQGFPGLAVSLDTGGIQSGVPQARDSAAIYRILARLVNHAASAPTVTRLAVTVVAAADGVHFQVQTDTDALTPLTAEAAFGDLKNRAWHLGGVLRFGADGKHSRAELVVMH